MTECSCWAEIPQDAFQHLVSHLRTNEFCTLRLVSRIWSSYSRQITTPRMAVLSSRANLSVKIATLASWRQAGRFANFEFSFQIDEPMSLLGISRTIKALTHHQGSLFEVYELLFSGAVPKSKILLACALQERLTNCKVLVQLRHPTDYVSTWPDYSEHRLEDAQQTAELAQQLLDENEVELCITMRRRSQYIDLAAPEVISTLTRFLCVFDMYSIPTEQPAASLPQRRCDLSLSTCSHKQVSELKYSNIQVCTLKVETDPGEYQKSTEEGQWSYDALIADVATMMHLTKLHLSLNDVFHIEHINLEPLTCLTLLEDLALQYYDDDNGDLRCDPICCQGVLTSNKHILHNVILTGHWTVATYYALQECSELEILSISISQLDVDQAQAFASISADSFRLILHRQLEPSVLAAISHSQPKVHMLTVWGKFQDQILRLPELLSLQELTLVNFVPFMLVLCQEPFAIAAGRQWYRPVTGEELACCPMVTQLTLIDCPGISSKGLHHIIEKALPALQGLSIQASKKPDSHFSCNCARTVVFDADSLHALCLGSSLRSVDLRGVSGLTYELLLQYRVALHLKQCQGDAPSSVELLLPRVACLDKAVYGVRTEWSMFLPNILRTADCTAHVLKLNCLS